MLVDRLARIYTDSVPYININISTIVGPFVITVRSAWESPDMSRCLGDSIDTNTFAFILLYIFASKWKMILSTAVSLLSSLCIRFLFSLCSLHIFSQIRTVLQTSKFDIVRLLLNDSLNIICSGSKHVIVVPYWSPIVVAYHMWFRKRYNICHSFRTIFCSCFKAKILFLQSLFGTN